MPSRPSKEDVLNAYRRAALMDAARRVFGRHGFEQATMEAIAREAGVAKGTIYLYYPSKQAIYEATFAACMAELEQRTRERVEAAATPRDAVAAFVATRVEYFQDTHDFFRMYVAEIGRQVGTGNVGPHAARQRRGAIPAARQEHVVDLRAQIQEQAVGRIGHEQQVGLRDRCILGRTVGLHELGRLGAHNHPGRARASRISSSRIQIRER